MLVVHRNDINSQYVVGGSKVSCARKQSEVKERVSGWARERMGDPPDDPHAI